MDNFNLNTALNSYIVGQKRTGKNKQFVFLTPDVAIKGPYTNSARKNNVINRTNIFNMWKTPCVVKALGVYNTSDGDFITFPNLMTGHNLSYESYFEPFSQLTYNVLTNPPIDTLRVALPNNPWIINNAEDLLLGLVHCNILGVGDMNFRNILVDPIKRLLYIIDFDDNLGTDRDDPVFYFNKAPAASSNWYERVKYHYLPVAERITSLLNDKYVLENNLTDRVNRAIKLLRLYGSNIVTNPGIAPEFTPVTSPLVPTTPRFGSVTSPLVPSTPGISPVTSPGPTLNILNKGDMVWKGLRGGNSKTASGVEFDVAKSALQKYIRRNIPDKAILTAVEIFRFAEFGGTAPAAVSNMYNRLAIIANEDIGVANVPLVLAVTEFVKAGSRDIYTLVPVVHSMCISPKTRIMSHAWNVYAQPEGREKGIALGLPIDTNLREGDNEFIAEYINSDIFLPSDPEHIRPYLLVFWKRLIDRDFNAFSWVYFYLQLTKELTVTKRRKSVANNAKGTTGKATILLWRVLSKVLPNETHDILVDAYFKYPESRPFLQNAIIIALYRVPYGTYDFGPSIKIWEANRQIIDDMLQGKYKLEIDDYVLDIHTGAGRKKGSTSRQFVNEGAIVIPQDPNYYVPILDEIYKDRN